MRYGDTGGKAMIQIQWKRYFFLPRINSASQVSVSKLVTLGLKAGFATLPWKTRYIILRLIFQENQGAHTQSAE